MEFLKAFLQQEYVKAALGVVVGYGVSFLPVPVEIKVAVAALVTGLLGFWAAYKANAVYKANKILKLQSKG